MFLRHDPLERGENGQAGNGPQPFRLSRRRLSPLQVCDLVVVHAPVLQTIPGGLSGLLRVVRALSCRLGLLVVLPGKEVFPLGGDEVRGVDVRQRSALFNLLAGKADVELFDATGYARGHAGDTPLIRLDRPDRADPLRQALIADFRSGDPRELDSVGGELHPRRHSRGEGRGLPSGSPAQGHAANGACAGLGPDHRRMHGAEVLVLRELGGGREGARGPGPALPVGGDVVPLGGDQAGDDQEEDKAQAQIENAQESPELVSPRFQTAGHERAPGESCRRPPGPGRSGPSHTRRPAGRNQADCLYKPIIVRETMAVVQENGSSGGRRLICARRLESGQAETVRWRSISRPRPDRRTPRPGRPSSRA